MKFPNQEHVDLFDFIPISDMRHSPVAHRHDVFVYEHLEHPLTILDSSFVAWVNLINNLKFKII